MWDGKNNLINNYMPSALEITHPLLEANRVKFISSNNCSNIFHLPLIYTHTHTIPASLTHIMNAIFCNVFCWLLSHSFFVNYQCTNRIIHFLLHKCARSTTKQSKRKNNNKPRAKQERERESENDREK